ncbi:MULTISPECIES: replication-associated recombination protein A [Ruminococcus]|uniref:Replication-associated recombination protein A n=1 Tax=Ruminococcus bovis TaxID=2564099 RepID=A0A4P8XVP5_9FIRM|nr:MULTISPECIES: replication-associated recombination protein A [Ruminococcus]MEE3439665.1 replication-associated recombination protein A [Ruminococcus sp.]QCT07166.1 replication-associated recombination protein A [Ruminococcus bovis]
MQPLADRLRPATLDDIVGQKHILGEGKPLRKIIESNKIPNLIFYGPSGVGKTTLATYIAKKTNMTFKKLNGTTASTSDLKDIFKELDGFAGLNGVLLYLDEIQYFNKKQQQTLLEYIENGKITLIASTTENPYFYVYNAILSRSTVFEFKPVPYEEVEKAVRRAFSILADENGISVEIDDKTVKTISVACGGDVRKAMNSAELSFLATDTVDGVKTITEETAKDLTQRSAMRYDREGDEHYDILSAYQKSMRGSDANAALHYLARLLIAGDLISACRRLMVCACEDVGLAYPNLIPIVKCCVDIAMSVGLPEARIPLADAVIMVCNAPKSNSGEMAIDKAMADIKAGNVGSIPRQLQNTHYDGEDNQNKGQHYLYPHDYDHHYVVQQYLPDILKNRQYYTYGDNKNEQAFKAYWDKIKP